jgi:hypothetical protein
MSKPPSGFFPSRYDDPILGLAGLHAAFVCVAPRCREAKKNRPFGRLG